MEFENTVLRVSEENTEHIRKMLTPGGGLGVRQTVLEELGDEVDPSRPPRWIMFGGDDELDDILHMASPMFYADGIDADEFFTDVTDQLLYIDAMGEALLHDGDKEYDVAFDRVNFDEVVAYMCGSDVLFTNFKWFESTPEGARFMDAMAATEAAYHGHVPAYEMP